MDQPCYHIAAAQASVCRDSKGMQVNLLDSLDTAQSCQLHPHRKEHSLHTALESVEKLVSSRAGIIFV